MLQNRTLNARQVERHEGRQRYLALFRKEQAKYSVAVGIDEREDREVTRCYRIM